MKTDDAKNKGRPSSFNVVVIFISALLVLLYGWQLLEHWGPQQTAAAVPADALSIRQLSQQARNSQIQHLEAAAAEAAIEAAAASPAAAAPQEGSAAGKFVLPARTLQYFPQVQRCSTKWMQQHAQTHADIRSGQLPARYFVSVAVEAGLADRLAGLMTHFWHAVLTNRALTTAAYGTVPAFSAMCDAPYVDWTSRPEGVPDEAIEPLKFTYLGKRGYPGKDRYLPANLDPETYQMLYLVNGPSKNLTVYQHSNISTLMNPDPAYLLASSNRGRTWAMANNPYHKQQFWEYGVPPEDAFMCGFFFLCSPVAAIQQYYAKYWEALREPGVLKIGIQIRLGDGVFRGADKEQPPEETLKVGADWFECAKHLEKAYAAPGQKVVWYLNSDSQQVRKAAKAVYGDKLITDDELMMTHPDCHQGKEKSACEQAAMDSALQHSLGAMLTFSMTDYHIITKSSGFGRLGAWLSGRWGNIYQITKGQGTCTAGKPIPPSESAFTYSGV